MSALFVSLALLLLTGWGLGGWLRARRDASPLPLDGGTCTLAGLLALAALLPNLSQLGLGKAPALAVVYVAAVLGAIRHVRAGLRFDPLALAGDVLLALLLVTPILFTATTPPLRFDAIATWWPKVREVSAGLEPLLLPSADQLHVHPEYPRGLAWLATVAWPWSEPDPRWVKLSTLVFTWLAARCMIQWGRALANPWGGAIAAALFVTLPEVAQWSHSGYADLPIGAAVLLMGLGLAYRTRCAAGGALVAVAAVGAASIKQEGAVLLLLAGIVFALDLVRGSQPRARAAACLLALGVVVPWWLSRAGGPAEVLAPTRQVLAQPELLVARLVAIPTEIAAYLVRPRSIDGGAGHLPWSTWAVIAALLVALPRGWRPLSILPVLALLAADAAVYVVSHHDIAWHVRTALPRILLQVLPLLLFVAVERLATEVEQGRPADDRDTEPRFGQNRNGGVALGVEDYPLDSRRFPG